MYTKFMMNIDWKPAQLSVLAAFPVCREEQNRKKHFKEMPDIKLSVFTILVMKSQVGRNQSGQDLSVVTSKTLVWGTQSATTGS